MLSLKLRLKKRWFGLALFQRCNWTNQFLDNIQEDDSTVIFFYIRKYIF